MTNQSVDVVIIGAGSAGLSALKEVRKRTENFLLINDGPYGTTCARNGCMPSKALIEIADLYHTRHKYHMIGVSGAAGLSIDTSVVMRRVRELRDSFVNSTLALTSNLGERNIQGKARFIGPQTLKVSGKKAAPKVHPGVPGSSDAQSPTEETDDEILINTKSTIIATGSRPIVPSHWQYLAERMATSNDIFNWDTLPRSIAVIGLGGAGLEIAQALHRLEVEVYGFEAKGYIGGLTDPLVNQVSLEILQKELSISVGVSAEMDVEGDKIRVYGRGGSTVVDKAFVAVGRRPNIEDLGIEELAVDTNESGVPAYNPLSMQVGDLPVYIAGDVNRGMPLLHEANHEGRIAGTNALRAPPQEFARSAPLMILFTDPTIAIAGQSYDSLKEREPVIGRADFSGQGRLRMSAEDRGVLRIYAERGTGLLLGSEMCVPQGEHLAHMLAWAIQQGLSVDDLLAMPFYHPVVEEGLRNALDHVKQQLDKISARP
jgi:dihydrolipoamide dehydrogenase